MRRNDYLTAAIARDDRRIRIAAETRALRHPDAPICCPHPWIERVRLHFEPQDLHQRLLDERRNYVDRSNEPGAKIGAVRRYLHAARAAKIDHAEHFADAANLGYAWLRDIDRARLDQRLKAEHASDVLASSNRNTVAAYLGEPMTILRRPFPEIVLKRLNS